VARLFRVIGSTTSKPASAAIGATILLLMGSPIISRGATIEEVARCRAIEINKERWDCFKALKAPKRNDTSPSQTEDFPKPKPEGVPKTKTLDAPPAALRGAQEPPSDDPRTKRNDTSPSQTEDFPKPKPEGVPKTKTLDAPPAALRGAQEPPSDDPVTTSSIDHPVTVLGRPLCADRDALAAMLIAGVLGSSPTEAATNGCQAIPQDAQIELVERYPSALHFLRVIKVKVTSPGQSDSTIGFTIETDR
jgi:hypothetical protein